MTTNAIPSLLPEDFEINIGNLDRVINSPSATFTDRFGVARPTVAGLGTAYMPANMAIKNLSGSLYTVAVEDSLGYIRFVGTDGPITCNIPQNSSQAFAVGTQINICQGSQYQVTITPASGVTINKAETLKTRKQGSLVTLVKIGVDEWDLIGDTEAA